MGWVFWVANVCEVATSAILNKLLSNSIQYYYLKLHVHTCVSQIFFKFVAFQFMLLLLFESIFFTNLLSPYGVKSRKNLAIHGSFLFLFFFRSNPTYGGNGKYFCLCCNIQTIDWTSWKIRSCLGVLFASSNSSELSIGRIGGEKGWTEL